MKAIVSCSAIFKLGLACLVAACSAQTSVAEPELHAQPQPQSPAMDRLSPYDTIDACLYREASPEGRQSCIGEYRTACERLAADGETTVGMMQCAADEYEAWDRWLNAAYRDLRESLSEASVAQLREAQRSWMAHRDQDCEYLAGLYAGGSLENVERASCQVRKTAQRAIELMHWDEAYPPL